MEPAPRHREPVLAVVFYRTKSGTEPVREWLKGMDREDRKMIGEDIKTAQFGWPLGMPLIREIEPDLWEVRSRISQEYGMKKKHVGGNFDDFLREEGLLDVTEATAIKRAIAFQIAQEMKRRRLTKSAMASRMRTSRAALERLLDPYNPSLTLATLERAALALGKKLRVELA